MEKDFEEKLLKDLKKSGFHSEIECMQILVSNGLSCTGGATYHDLDSEITRNIDIRALISLEKDFGEVGGIGIEYVLHIEVKKTERPWVVFKSDEKTITSLAYGDTWQNPTVTKNLPCKRFQLTPCFQHYSIRKELGWIGYAVHEAFKEPNDMGRWFSSAVTTCKSCYDFVRRSPYAGESTIFNGQVFALITQPVVVLDGPLYAVNMNSNSEISFEEIPYAPFLFEFGTGKYTENSYRVDLVTLKNLDKYIAVINKRAESVFENLIDLSGK